MAHFYPHPGSILPLLIAWAFACGWPLTARAADPRLTVKETPLAAIPADANRSSLRLSPDGARIAYDVTRNEGVHAVIDGKEGPPYPYVTLVSSADGFHFGYIGRGPTGKGVIVREGSSPLGPFDYAGDLFLSRDGSRWAARWSHAKKSVLVVDGREVTESGISFQCFSPDSQHLFFTSRKDDLVQVVVDGKAQKVYAKLTTIAFSGDGRHYVYGAQDAPGQWVIVIDGAEAGKVNVDELANPRVSDDARHTAFAARLADGRECAVIDGTAQKPYRRLIIGDPPVLSADGRRFAYPAMLPDKTGVMVCDGRESKPWGSASLPTFSPDSKTFAYVRLARTGGKTGARLIVNDAETGNEYLTVRKVAYSPDSGRVAMIARDDRGWIPVFDGAEANPCEQILPNIYFDGNAGFHCFAIRDGKLIRVDVAAK